VLTATHRHRAVGILKNRPYSERPACRVVGFSCSASWRPLNARNDTALRLRLEVLAERCPCSSYPTLHDMLKTEVLVINPKQTYQLYREECLQVLPTMQN
jgi:putative transposase